MTRFQAGPRSENTALLRRRLPLPTAPDRSELPDPIRRPALVPAGGGYHPDIQIITQLSGAGAGGRAYER